MNEAAVPAVLGLGAAFLWGTADFFAKRHTDNDGSLRTLFWLYLVGTPIFLGAWLWGGAPGAPLAAVSLWILSGILNAVAYVALYRGFRVGLLSVVSTTNASWAAFTVLLAVVFLGERPDSLATTGIFLTVAGVVLVAYPGGEWRVRAPGFVEGFVSAFLFGASFFLLKLPLAQGDVLAQSTVMRMVGLLLVGGFLVYQGVRLTRAYAKRPPLFSFLDSAGFLVFIAALAAGATFLVAPLASLMTPITVILAAVFLHERLKPHQWAGFGLVILGALLLAGQI